MPEVLRYSLTERTIALRTIPQLGKIPSRDIHAIAKSLEEKRFAPGELLLSESERADSLFIVLSGSVETWHLGVRFGTIRAPGGAGLLPLYARNAGGTKIVALEETDVLILDEDTLRETMDEHFAMFLFILRFLSERLLNEVRGLGQGASQDFIRNTLASEHRTRVAPPSVSDAPLTLLDRIFFLRSLPQFRTTNVNAVAAWGRRFEERRYAPGERIWRVGDPADAIVFLVHGDAEQRADGKVLTFAPPLAIGGPEAILGQQRWSECVALSPLTTLRSSTEALFDICEDDLDVGLSFAAFLANLLQSLWLRKAAMGASVY